MGSRSNSFTIAVFEGDGIGPEITRPTLDLLEAVARRSGDFDLSFDLLPAGAGHYRDAGFVTGSLDPKHEAVFVEHAR